MANLSSVLARTASDYGESPAVRLDDLVLTYSQLQDAADRAASLLSSLGVAPGDRVGIMLPNVPAFPIAYYGALGAGATVVPMNPLLKNREVAYYLGDSGAKVLVAWHEAAAEAAKGAAGTGVQVIEVDEPDMHTLLARLSPAAKRADQASDDNAVITATTSTRARSRTPCTSIKPSPRSPSSASRIPSWARKSAPPWCSSRERRPPPRNFGLSPGNGWRPTSIRAMSGSSAPCPRALPARSCTAKCSRRKTSCRDRYTAPGVGSRSSGVTRFSTALSTRLRPAAW